MKFNLRSFLVGMLLGVAMMSASLSVYVVYANLEMRVERIERFLSALVQR